MCKASCAKSAMKKKNYHSRNSKKKKISKAKQREYAKNAIKRKWTRAAVRNFYNLK
jgi:hypothetical protein